MFSWKSPGAANPENKAKNRFPGKYLADQFPNDARSVNMALSSHFCLEGNANYAMNSSVSVVTVDICSHSVAMQFVCVPIKL